ncbi:hypothetical protein C8P64_2376 [Christiangramia gaetbulicola]|uniref:Uncharacterized protein n=1 Tax=Christiangramia gaetbulicola TaxID=703340 RepID=A0A2T6ADW1_9FLAO|nr:hypothetical protein [Christiangramia gaetbulicola]PTX41962.1 hypothetical protein C8P64_2376 [Christiangramia gaetbulicola]
MSHLRIIKLVLPVIISGLLLTSCFKDVDFGQSEDISLEPDLEVDLLFYQLNETDFLDSETNAFTPVIRDTVRLEFLDDDYIQDGLMYAALRFKHENKFPYEINSNIKFLRENGRGEFNVAYTIPPGSEFSSAVVDTTHILEGNNIVNLRRSIQMVVELEIVGANQSLQGELEFMSKGLFRFEF